MLTPPRLNERMDYPDRLGFGHQCGISPVNVDLAQTKRSKVKPLCGA